MQFDIEINGIMVHAAYTEENINEIFIPLLKNLKAMQESAKKRILVMLAAPPGAGKSTLLAFLQYLSEHTDGLTPIQIIGMDGFHHYQDYLLSHTTIRDGKEIPMVKIKGAPITFDLPLLEERIKKVANGETVGWPTYNRMTHNPKENDISVTGNIVLLEGNYLLLEEDGWRNLRQYADYTVKISADEAFLQKRLTDRKIKSGTTPEEAAAFVSYSDMVNVHTCLTKSGNADLEITVLSDGTYQ